MIILVDVYQRFRTTVHYVPRVRRAGRNNAEQVPLGIQMERIVGKEVRHVYGVFN